MKKQAVGLLVTASLGIGACGPSQTEKTPGIHFGQGFTGQVERDILSVTDEFVSDLGCAMLEVGGTITFTVGEVPQNNNNRHILAATLTDDKQIEVRFDEYFFNRLMPNEILDTTAHEFAHACDLSPDDQPYKGFGIYDEVKIKSTDAFTARTGDEHPDLVALEEATAEALAKYIRGENFAQIDGHNAVVDFLSSLIEASNMSEQELAYHHQNGNFLAVAERFMKNDGQMSDEEKVVCLIRYFEAVYAERLSPEVAQPALINGSCENS